MNIALVTEKRYEANLAAEGDWYLGNILADDGLLIDALNQLGHSSERVDWARPDVDWSRFDAAVIRTTWDYFEHTAEFYAWIERVSNLTRLLNPAPLVMWNLDKHYLADLDRQGVAIVPTRYIERGDTESLAEHVRRSCWQEAVIKPCISGAARHTYRVNTSNADSIGAIVRPLIVEESFLIQPFQQSIIDFGEITLMVFGGKFTHAVRKVAKPGDFRVQDDHGGKVYAYVPTAEEIAFAERAVAVCPQPPVYARVDLVRDERGQLVVMELEMIEPELWIRFHPPSAVAFADAIVANLGD